MADFLLALAFGMMLLTGYGMVSRLDRFLEKWKSDGKDINDESMRFKPRIRIFHLRDISKYSFHGSENMIKAGQDGHVFAIKRHKKA